MEDLIHVRIGNMVIDECHRVDCKRCTYDSDASQQNIHLHERMGDKKHISKGVNTVVLLDEHSMKSEAVFR